MKHVKQVSKFVPATASEKVEWPGPLKAALYALYLRWIAI